MIARGSSGQVRGVETWDAIRARRNVRDYADRPITDEQLNQILEAVRGGRAPRPLVADGLSLGGSV